MKLLATSLRLKQIDVATFNYASCAIQISAQDENQLPQWSKQMSCSSFSQNITWMVRSEYIQNILSTLTKMLRINKASQTQKTQYRWPEYANHQLNQYSDELDTSFSWFTYLSIVAIVALIILYCFCQCQRRRPARISIQQPTFHLAHQVNQDHKKKKPDNIYKNTFHAIGQVSNKKKRPVKVSKMYFSDHPIKNSLNDSFHMHINEYHRRTSNSSAHIRLFVRTKHEVHKTHINIIIVKYYVVCTLCYRQ